MTQRLGEMAQEGRNPSENLTSGALFRNRNADPRGRRLSLIDGADHGFFCEQRPDSYDASAAADAWSRLLALFGEHLR